MEQSADSRIREAVKAIAKALEERGVLRERAREIAERHAERIFVSSGQIRIASAAGTFYPASVEAPFEPLVAELYRAVPPGDKASASADDVEAARQRLKRSGLY